MRKRQERLASANPVAFSEEAAEAAEQEYRCAQTHAPRWGQGDRVTRRSGPENPDPQKVHGSTPHHIPDCHHPRHRPRCCAGVSTAAALMAQAMLSSSCPPSGPPTAVQGSV